MLVAPCSPPRIVPNEYVELNCWFRGLRTLYLFYEPRLLAYYYDIVCRDWGIIFQIKGGLPSWAHSNKQGLLYHLFFLMSMLTTMAFVKDKKRLAQEKYI